MIAEFDRRASQVYWLWKQRADLPVAFFGAAASLGDGSTPKLWAATTLARFSGAADDKSVSFVAVERGAVAMAGHHPLQEQTRANGVALEPTEWSGAPRCDLLAREQPESGTP
jgi:hypothetical protein